MASKINIIIVGGPLDSTKYGFDVKMQCTIGRKDDCDICIPKEHAEGISKRHCILSVDPPETITLKDLGSSNGTYLNHINICDPIESGKLANRQINDEGEYLLKHNDEIIIGKIFFKVKFDKASFKCEKCSAPVDVSAINLDKVEPGHILCENCYNLQSDSLSSRTSLANTPIAKPPPGTNTLRKIAKVEALKETALFIDNFNIKRILGRGSMGLVYLAENLKNGKEEALKLLIPEKAFDDESKDQFLQEVDFLQHLKHPNIIRVHDSGIAQGTFYFTMEYCESGNIENLLKVSDEPLEVDETMKIALQCINALDYAHSQGLVHRDIKPENIFLKATGKNSFTVKIGDFGVAKALEIAGYVNTPEDFIFGTLDYIPKQQILDYKNVRPEWDIWSLTASIYYMLTKKCPRILDPNDPVTSVLRIQPVPISTYNPVIPKKLARFIDCVLKGIKGYSFESAKQFRSALIEVM